MELVIKIPEIDYKHFKDLVNSLPKDPIFVDTVAYYIGNGTPLPKGHWIEVDNGYICSECDIIRAKGTTGKYNYCPNCGADMTDKENEE